MELLRSDPSRAQAKTVLLVDDEHELLEGYKQTLRAQPYRVVSAQSAPEALKILDRQQIDVAVVDQQMPKMTGTQLLSRLRHQCPNLVRIMLTGQATLATATGAINEGGVFRFLEKPCPPEKLRETIGAALAHQNQLSAFRWDPALHKQLTAREREVAEALVNGSRVGRVAKTMGLSTHTVRNHLRSVFSKLDVHSQAQLVDRLRQ